MWPLRIPRIGCILVLVCSLGGNNQAMGGDIDEVLNTRDDFKLCGELYTRLIKHYGKDIDLSKCKRKHQVVLLVWYATGIIDNGGFQYLFEGKFKGDPHFLKTAAAFKAVKAKKCAKAAEEALKLFPNSKPPADLEKRLTIYQSHRLAKRLAIDDKFFSESSKIPKLLAKYIRANRKKFTNVK